MHVSLEQVAALRKTLGARRCRVALLHVVERLTQQQIAGRLGIRQQNVSKHLAAIRRRFPTFRFIDCRRSFFN